MLIGQLGLSVVSRVIDSIIDNKDKQSVIKDTMMRSRQYGNATYTIRKERHSFSVSEVFFEMGRNRIDKKEYIVLDRFLSSDRKYHIYVALNKRTYAIYLVCQLNEKYRLLWSMED